MVPPSRITADVRRLCRKLGDVEEPVFVEVEPRTDSGLNDCFMDVQRQVAEFGGSVQHGWLIWLLPGILIEGEFHSVWRRPDASLLDVTFKQDRERQILFAPDRVRQFADLRVPTIRHAIGRDPRIKQFMELSERFQRLAGERYRDRFGQAVVLEDDLIALRRRMTALGVELMQSREARRASGQSFFPPQAQI